jgi:plasmid stabilization system protein ParE
MSGYGFHPESVADLDEIWEHIAQDNIDAADGVLADIHSSLTTLAASPQIGHRRTDLTARPLRFHVVRDEYLIAYAPDASPLWVVAVLHGRRNPHVMTAILRGRKRGRR